MNITAHNGPRPLAVKIAVVLLAASGGTDLLLRTLWHQRNPSKDPDFYFSLAVVFITMSVFIYFLFRGHNWARWVTLFMVAVGTLLSLSPHYGHSGLYFFYTLMNAVAVVELFRRPSSQWFRGRANDARAAA